MKRVNTSIFVVSDLHIGGADGFRMCEASGRKRLAELLDWIGKQASDTLRVRIVIAGDIVDFLAEEPFAAFTADEEVATRKLRTILAASSEVWDALARAARSCAITMMLGNHDVELALTTPRRLLLERIGGNVEFLCDNEAFAFGELLIEHGNRYDSWNAVDHDGLRQLKSRSSRREPLEEFATQPGSELVARVMNKYKQKHPWVDLLKPETAGVIPILAALGGSTWQIAADVAKAAAGAKWRSIRLGSGGTPSDPRFIAESAEAAAQQQQPVDDLAEVFALFEELAGTPTTSEGDARMVGEGAVTFNEELLFRGLRLWGEKDNRTFQVDQEKKEYLRAAKLLAERGGYKVVVFGHTHHAKCIDLEGGARYLNTGTWADLMRIPEAILNGDEPDARLAFRDFVIRLKTGVDELRRLVPTFARIDFDDLNRIQGDPNIFFFDEGAKITPVETRGILERLGERVDPL